MKRANRVLFIALGFFMFMGLVSAVKQPARADGPVYYLDCKDRENDPDDVSLVKKEAANYVVVDSQTISWEAGNIYVVNTDTEIDERITAKGIGDVRLILCDGGTLTAPKGITVEEYTAFHIHAGSTGADILGTGKLDISPKNEKKVDDHCAGIGGKYGKVTGAIFIYGGNIIATGGSGGAGIGDGDEGLGETIEINGGIVTANGGEYGAGIGGGSYCSGGTIDILYT